MAFPGSEKALLSETARLRTAHVLFADIADYSQLTPDEQTDAIGQLESIVRDLPGFPGSLAAEELICIPSGDGIGIVCFGAPTLPARFARDLAIRIQEEADFELRIGLHSGPVYCPADISDCRNVAGDGVDIAQSVMDCGDAGHILLSQPFAEILQQMSQWRDLVHDLGECEVEHGVRLRIFNLFTKDFGNAGIPHSIQQTYKGHKGNDSESTAAKGAGLALKPGDKLGSYEIISPIGEGNMGQVWKARDTRLNRFVALKASKSEFTDRFERELRIVAAFRHPGICQLYDVGSNYLAMELIDGAPLPCPLPAEKAVAYAGQILDALHAAHRKGFTHRNLKPAHILLTKQGIKLLDFGLAKQTAGLGTDDGNTAALTMEGHLNGILQYMAPEQLQGKEADARSDIFSFGCVLYEMLGGVPAFSGATGASVMAAILEREPDPLKTTPPLDRIVRTCLAKDPDQRFQDALDLKRDLMWALEDGDSVGAGRRAQWVWIAVVAVLTILLAALALLYFRE